MAESVPPEPYTESQQMAHDLMAPIRAAQTFLGFAIDDLDDGDATSARTNAQNARVALAESMEQLEAAFSADASE